MPLALPVVWSDAHRRHVPDGEVWVGVRIPGTELPERAERIRAALEAAGAPVGRGRRRSRTRRCTPSTTRRSRSTWPARGTPGARPASRRTRARTASCPTSSPTGACPRAPPAAVHARAGLFAYDTMTLIGPGTWEAARAAIDVAVTAAELAAGRRPAGLRALPPARPPRHADDLRRLLLPQQQRGRRRGAARAAGRAGGRARHRRPPRQRHAGDLLRRPRRCSPAPSTSTRAPAGSPTSRASRTRRAPAARATATSACRPARATTRGWPPCASWPTGRAARGRWSWRSGSTPRPGTPRRRCAVTAGRLPRRGARARGARPADGGGAGGRLRLGGDRHAGPRDPCRARGGTAWLGRCGWAGTSTRGCGRSRARTSPRRPTGAWRRSRSRSGRTP